MMNREKCLLFSRYTQFKDRVADRQAGVQLMKSIELVVQAIKEFALRCSHFSCSDIVLNNSPAIELITVETGARLLRS